MEPFDLYSPLIDADPFPYYAELREKYPCYWSDSAQLWILSRYDDIVEAARDWQTFSSAAGQHDRRASRARRRDARNHRSAAPRSAARLEPGRVSQAQSRPARRADAGNRRSLARPHRRARDVRVHQRLFQPDHRRPVVPHHGPARPRSRRDQAQGHPRGLDRQDGEGAHARTHRRVQGAAATFSPPKWRRGGPIRPTI